MAPEHSHRRAVTQRLCGFVLTLLVAAASIVPVRVQAAEPLPPTLLLAERYRDDIDVSRYWISEKLDGVRAIWNGKILQFRSGNPVPAPKWFVDALPRQPLDGELWLGRGSFDQLSSIVRRQTPDDAEWRRVRYMIFELPNASGSFGDRIEQIMAVTTVVALQKRLRHIVRQGGEGLMLHKRAMLSDRELTKSGMP